MPPENFHCYLVTQGDEGDVSQQVRSLPLTELPAGEVLIKVQHSSLNYKDAMAASGHAGIVRKFPHVPGIDAVGTVVASGAARLPVGSTVLATGHEWGVERWGGWSEFLSGPAEWFVPLPKGLSPLEAMTLGTAGFTAAQSVLALVEHHITPESGRIIVTGATGGVGVLSVMILAKLGYDVLAITGKSDQHDWLKSLGASEVADRSRIPVTQNRPLLKSEFAGAIDTVGGSVLATLCKMIHHRGCVACCGVVAGTDLPLTVYPFILRGLTLAGIDSAWCPDADRQQIWQRLAGDWKPTQLDAVQRLVSMEELPEEVEKMLGGKSLGRVVTHWA